VSPLELLRKLGRWVLLSVVRLVLPTRDGAPRIDVHDLHKVLLVRVDPRLGNVLLTTPLARALDRGIPGAEVHWLVASKFRPVLEGLPFLEVVLPFDKRDFFLRPWRFVGLVLRLRRERYDVAIDASHWHAFSFTSAALTFATGAPIRIGHARHESSRFLTHAVAHRPEHASEVDAKLELLAPLGLAPAGRQLETKLGAGGRSQEEILELLSRAGVPSGRHVALNPGGRKADHRWSAAGFGAVAKRLAECGRVPVVYWGPGEEPLAREVVTASEGTAHLAPPTDIAQLAAAFRESEWVVTNDTGPMHLAAAVGARTIAIAIAVDAARWVHEQPGFVAIQAQALEETVNRIVAAIQVTSSV
jgi:heptosyltransferase-3